MPTPADAGPGEGPYKGTDSFQVQDRDLFFGREREALTLVSKILSSRCTLLHARSGVGKTSLLNARVVPLLEAKGWTPVQVRLDQSPVDSIRLNTFRWVAPPPATEVLAVERARAALSRADEDPTVLELLARYDRLEVSDRRRRDLIAPVGLPPGPRYLGYPASGEAIPYFTRLLRRSIDFARFDEHVRLVGSFAGAEPRPGAGADEVRVGDLLGVLRDEVYQASYAELLAELNGPVGDLAGFFRTLFDVWGRLHASFGLVLLMDQFEELFTLFSDTRLGLRADAGTRPLWEVRRQFLRELEGVYAGRWGERGRLPVRLVISMREEFIAQLDPVRRFVPELDDSAFHLALLDRGAADAAIREPAKRFGVEYEPEAREAILAALALEEQLVAPITLQIVCTKLWQELQREAAAAREAGAEPPRAITPEHLTRVGGERGVAGILDRFFDEFLTSLGEPEVQREALDLLAPLITSGGTRNIVLRSELVRARYRDDALRETVMRKLVRGGIVRVERRLESEFAEIMHEFLIAPVLKHIRETLSRDPDYHRLQGAVRALARFQDREIGDDEGLLLGRDELEDIRLSAARLVFPSFAPELVLRSTLRLGHQLDDLAGHLGFCRGLFERAGAAAPDLAALLEELDERVDRDRWLRRDELVLLNQHRARLALTSQQARLVWVSELHRALPGEEEDVRYWSRKVAR